MLNQVIVRMELNMSSLTCPAGGRQQPSAGGSVQRAGQHGLRTAFGRRGGARSASKHPGPQRQWRRCKHYLLSIILLLFDFD